MNRNSKLAGTHGMHSYDGVLKGHEGILFKKAKVSGKPRWLYSFRDQRKASKEEDYLACSKRREIELVMRCYKQACELDETMVHGDYSLIGSEVASFLASVLTYRIINDAEKRKALEKDAYGRMMAKLERAKKIRLGGEWRMVRISPSEEELLMDLGILERPAEPPKRRPGRPKKNTI